jgi:hypothetical protein
MQFGADRLALSHVGQQRQFFVDFWFFIKREARVPLQIIAIGVGHGCIQIENEMRWPTGRAIHGRSNFMPS